MHEHSRRKCVIPGISFKCTAGVHTWFLMIVSHGKHSSQPRTCTEYNLAFSSKRLISFGSTTAAYAHTHSVYACVHMYAPMQDYVSISILCTLVWCVHVFIQKHAGKHAFENKKVTLYAGWPSKLIQCQQNYTSAVCETKRRQCTIWVSAKGIMIFSGGSSNFFPCAVDGMFACARKGERKTCRQRPYTLHDSHFLIAHLFVRHAKRALCLSCTQSKQRK